MTRHEQEDYGEEAHDLIEGLRRLAHELETPPDLLPHILARGQQLLFPQRGRFSRWWSLLASWRPQPLVWGPAIAIACFVAGMVVSPWHLGTSRSPTLSEQKEAKDSSQELTPPSVVQDDTPGRPVLSSRQEQSQPHADSKTVETRRTAQRVPHEGVPGEQHTETRRESLTASPAAPMRSPQSVSPPPSVAVTTVLPADLYERLVQAAQRRQQDIASLVQEAVEAYIHKTRRPE
jgi:hypothetical protein